MNWQNILVGLIVLYALWVVGRKYLGRRTKDKGCGCQGCTSNCQLKDTPPSLSPTEEDSAKDKGAL